ncbi:MAG: hypothetical protein NTX25_14925, partial [Proteobacteria bacterium]|nr:hypothetical protein [Pseudomonadota bacterium]
AKMAPIMLSFIVAALLAVIVLNVKSRPSCLRQEYIFCGTEEVLQEDHEHAEPHAAGNSHEVGSPHGE